MKSRILVFLAAIAMVSACSNQLNIEPKSAELQPSVKSNIRSYDEALQIAQSSIAMLENKDSKAATRSSQSRQIDLKDRQVIKLNSKTRASNGNDTLIYVFNFENDEGFALVSASKNTEPLLAVTEQGHYDSDVPSGIDAFDTFVDLAKEYVVTSMLEEPISYERDSIVEKVILTKSPLVTVKWGQTYPEGELCPNGKAGCTNTALGQLMSYYSFPSSINLTYPSHDISTQQLNWSQMKTHATGHNYNSCSNGDIHKSISRLMRQLGHLNQSDYSNSNTTGTIQAYMYGTMNDLGYNYLELSPLSTTQIKDKLNQNYPIVMSGQKDDLSSGHTWILDGYKYIQVTTYHYRRVSETSNEWYLLPNTDISYTYWMHNNWGWYGNCNGYFNPGVYNTQAGIIYDTTHNTANSNYTHSLTGDIFYPNS